MKAKSLAVLALLAALPLGACAVGPPTAPDIVAVPPAGKALADFQQDDLACRRYAAAGPGAGLGAAAAVGDSAQARYDVAYAQCMASKGDKIDNAVLPAPPPPPVFAYPVPGFGGWNGGFYPY